MFDIMALNPLKTAKYAKSVHIFKGINFQHILAFFKGFRAIISNKIYSLLLLFDTNVLSYISAFYDHFENFMF